jgi:hypothetical protein
MCRIGEWEDIEKSERENIHKNGGISFKTISNKQVTLVATARLTLD